MAPRLWRRHRGTALCSLLLLALLHRLNCLAFLAACAPVLVLTAFLLGVVLVHSDAVVPLSASAEDEHLYKRIRRHHHVIISSESPSSSSSVQDVDEEEEEEEEQEQEAAVAWTADDERSIQSIGSLELERDARLEKLIMSRRSGSSRHLDVRIPGGHSYDKDDPGSAPSSLLQLRHTYFHGHATNEYDDHVQVRGDEPLLTRHESFAAPLARPSSRLRPYFVTAAATDPPYFDKPAAAILDNNSSSNNIKSTSSSSSSSSSADASDHQETVLVMPQEEKAEEEEEEEAAAAPPLPLPPCNKWDGMAVDVELISDSSDDDMSLPGHDPTAVVSIMTRPEHSDDEVEDSFEVASITQQVAAGHQPQPHSMATAVPSPSGHQHQHHAMPEVEEKEREVVYDIREHHAMLSVPVVVNSSSSSSFSAAGAGSAGAGAGAAVGSSKSSIKFRAPSKKAVFGFFRK